MTAHASPAAWARPLSLGFDLILCAFLGALHTASFVYTEAWWLHLLCVGMLAWRVSVVAPARAFALGAVFGTAWLSAGTWWMFVSMHTYGGLPGWMAALAVLALSATLSLYLAMGMWVFARVRIRRPMPDALLFAACWLLAELARGVLFTGFPWVAAGYAHVDGPLAVLAPWIGVYGIGAAAAFLSAWTVVSRTAMGVRRVTVIAAAAIVLGVIGAHTGPIRFSAPGGTLAVTLLQGNIAQEQKFSSEHQGPALEWHVGAMLAATSDLVIAPETAVPFLPQQMPEGFWAALRNRFSAGPTHALFGVPLGDEPTGYTNSAVGFAPGRDEYRYDKHHLVPFGEFIPAGFRWFTEMMNIPLGDFRRGTLNAPSFVVKGERVAPNICYEDLFGEELAARFLDESKAPTIFANISNIGWFGDTIAIDQHLNISRMRALEFQRPMLRATNTGATVIIDHRGHVTQGLKPDTRGVLDGPVQGRTGLTPYAKSTAQFRLWPLAGVALLVLAAMAGAGRLRRTP
jgi:apolipoprotein N-acyltransferase